MLDFSILAEAVGVLKELGDGLTKLTGLPKERREHYRQVLDETFTVLDQALLLVTGRLADTLRVRVQNGDQAFMVELAQLQYVQEWEKLERDVRLCRSLREQSDEMRHLFSNIGDRLALKDPNSFWRMVACVLEGERTLADQITEMLSGLSRVIDPKVAAEGVKQGVETLRVLRRQLIESQIELSKEV
ncbi:MAG: hypothetical protein JSS66_05500 [Armatimonadetes bacterium]|nr:hypothetical protein [Armatimonadota bacterium]